MSKELLKKDRKEVMRHSDGHEPEILHPSHNSNPFMSFHYSYKEISSDGGKTLVKSKEKSFKNGKFRSEEFEGILPGNAYSSMVGEMQKIFFSQMTAFTKQFSLLLPFGGSRNKDR